MVGHFLSDFSFLFMTIIQADSIVEPHDTESLIDNGFGSASLEDAVVGLMDWRAAQESADELVAIAQDIEHRHSRIHVEDDSTLSLAPVPGDPSIWRIKVNVRTIVYIVKLSAHRCLVSLVKNVRSSLKFCANPLSNLDQI
jgi:hypothetical protein